MRMIIKFKLVSFATTLAVPVRSRVLSVHTQGGIPCVWIEVPVYKVGEPIFYISIKGYATGEQWKPDGENAYIGSCHDVNGNEVYHYYLS